MRIALLTLIALFTFNTSYSQCSQSKLDSLLSKMNRGGTLTARYIGHGHVTTEQFKAFETFKAIASTDQKLECLDNDNAVIRAYAFWSLCLADSTLAATNRDRIKGKNKRITCRFYGDIVYMPKLKIILNTFLFDPKGFFNKR